MGRRVERSVQTTALLESLLGIADPEDDGSLILVLDIADLGRLGHLGRPLAERGSVAACIDHHLSPGTLPAGAAQNVFPRSSTAWNRKLSGNNEGLRGGRQDWATSSFNSRDTLNTGTLRSGTGTASPVLGFLAIRALRAFTLNVPKPRIS